jgi:hypothetical protein
MKITVKQSTLHRYDFPLYLEPQICRLRPRMTNAPQPLCLQVDDAG